MFFDDLSRTSRSLKIKTLNPSSKHLLLKSSLIFSLIFSQSCQKVTEDIEPKIHFVMQEKYLQNLPSAVGTLSQKEKEESWGKEAWIGLKFARELDLYQAVVSFKRAQFLLSPLNKERISELEYATLLSYYLGKQYSSVVSSFEKSELRFSVHTSKYYEDLLVVLYDSYLNSHQPDRAANIFLMMQQSSPEKACKLHLFSTLSQGDFLEIEKIKHASQNTAGDFLSPLTTSYLQQRKNPLTAQLLNGLLPGSGYLYLGQKQTALTAFLMNGLFIGAAAHFFKRGNTAAAIITTSFEAGWYFGGIYGAGLEAKFYNERLFEKLATPVLYQQKLFPILMLQHAF